MSLQSNASSPELWSRVERALDRLGVLFLLVLGLGAAGATLLIGV